MGMGSDAGAWRHEKEEKERKEGVVLTAAEEREKAYEEACWLEPSEDGDTTLGLIMYLAVYIVWGGLGYWSSKG